MAGTGVSVGGISVSVGTGLRVSVGTGVSVAVGMGVGVRDAVIVGTGVFVGAGVLVGRGGRGVAVGRGRRVRVGGGRVDVGRRVAVSVGRGVNVAVFVGVRVGVGTNSVTACSVSAAAVLKLETARSTISSGAMVTGIKFRRSVIAIAETLHSRLNPSTPAARMVSGPPYSLNLTLVALLSQE